MASLLEHHASYECHRMHDMTVANTRMARAWSPRAGASKQGLGWRRGSPGRRGWWTELCTCMCITLCVYIPMDMDRDRDTPSVSKKEGSSSLYVCMCMCMICVCVWYVYEEAMKGSDMHHIHVRANIYLELESVQFGRLEEQKTQQRLTGNELYRILIRKWYCFMSSTFVSTKL